MNTIVFTDEVGLYTPNMNDKSKKIHPFYIRGNLFIDINDYKIIQEQFVQISKKYNIPADLEIKWSDLYLLKNHKSKKLTRYEYSKIEEYIIELIKMACSFENTRIFFTVTSNKVCNQTSKYKMIKFHLQEAFQRAQMDAAKSNTFSMFVIDELNKIDENILKSACHELIVSGDQFVRYENIYQGIFFDKSNQSVGLKLIDYINGVFNSYLKNQCYDEHNYLLGKQLYIDYVRNSLRKGDFDAIIGYGIKYVPSTSPINAKFKLINF